MTALRAFTEHVIPGRWSQVREPSEQELRATTVLSLPLAEVSAKIRTGPPKDDAEDYGSPVWAGELPLRLIAGTPLADTNGHAMQAVPDYIFRYDRRGKS